MVKNKKILFKFYFVVFSVFILYVFSAFENTYIILKNDYPSRVLKNSGYCEKQGYGFIKKILILFPDIRPNLRVYNNSDFPSALGHFYDYEVVSNDYLILLNFEKSKAIEFDKNFKILYQEDKCYLLKKNV